MQAVDEGSLTWTGTDEDSERLSALLDNLLTLTNQAENAIGDDLISWAPLISCLFGHRLSNWAVAELVKQVSSDADAGSSPVCPKLFCLLYTHVILVQILFFDLHHSHHCLRHQFTVFLLVIIKSTRFMVRISSLSSIFRSGGVSGN